MTIANRQQENQFIIDNKIFVYDQTTSDANHFAVRSTPRPYDVHWDESVNPLTHINTLLQQKPNHLLFIDQAVLKLYGSAITIPQSRIFAVEATESFKTIEGLCKVFDFLHTNQFTKGEDLFVVGGGIIQDVGGFVGAAYKRGIRWIYVPTTLLAMSDSCIGSKTGINYRNTKNQIAVFSAPAEIRINPYFLKTLPGDAIFSGLGEMLKYAIISGPHSLAIYQRCVRRGRVHQWADFKTLMCHSLAVKKSIIEEDEFELSYRRSLNYGHTFGHALEVLANYQIPHGIAVVIGVLLANEMSVEEGLLSEAEKGALAVLAKELIPEHMVRVLKQLPQDQFVELLKKDKKALSNAINFVIIKTAGHVQFLKCDLDANLGARLARLLQKVCAYW